MNPVLTRLLEQRSEQEAFIEQLLSRVEDEERDLVDAERGNLAAAQERVQALDRQITPLEEWEDTRRAHQSATPQPPARGQQTAPADDRASLSVTARGHEYRTRGEVIVDILRASPSSTGAKHPSGVASVSEHDQRGAVERLRGARVIYPGAEDSYVRAIQNETTAQLPGLLPKPIVGAIENDLDASRPFVQSIGARDLSDIPGKTFSRPIITQHALSDVQATEKGELASRQMIVGGVDFTKETHGGALDVSRQAIDWTSPSAWDALLNDLQDVYGIDTEEVAATAFATAITQEVPTDTNDLRGWATSLYQAAALAYGGSSRLPNHIWVSLDQWAAMGALVDLSRMAMRGGNNTDTLGSSKVTDFGGNVFDLPRTVVPSFPAGTVIVGVKEKTEFYEQRIGLLSAVEPRLLGIEIAYGGYIAYGTLVPGAFAKVTPPADAPDEVTFESPLLKTDPNADTSDAVGAGTPRFSGSGSSRTTKKSASSSSDTSK